MKAYRSVLLTLIGLIIVLPGGPVSAADDQTDTTGKVSIRSRTVGAGIGYTWGDGVLEYRGQTYPFTVTGFSIGDVGASRTLATGEVYDLKSVEDFSGIFMAAVASASVGGGAEAAAMQNQNRVRIVWTGTNQGVNFALAPTGLNVALSGAAQPAAAPRTSR